MNGCNFNPQRPYQLKLHKRQHLSNRERLWSDNQLMLTPPSSTDFLTSKTHRFARNSASKSIAPIPTMIRPVPRRMAIESFRKPLFWREANER